MLIDANNVYAVMIYDTIYDALLGHTYCGSRHTSELPVAHFFLFWAPANGLTAQRTFLNKIEPTIIIS